MLGRLARWLRVVGFDTTYDDTNPDPVLVRTAAAESRVLLTRDRHLLRELRPARALGITSDAPLGQLAEVVRACSLAPPAELFTRCLVCNAPLAAVPPDEAAAVLPPAARELAAEARRCPSCGRLYWPGSHTRRMRAALQAALPGWAP